MKNILLITLISFFSFGSFSQEKAKINLEKWTIRAEYFRPKGIASFANATVNGYHFPSNFGFRVGAERDWKKTDLGRFYQSANYSFYNDVYFERVSGLETSAGIQLNVFKGLFISTEFTLGYNFARSSHLASKYESDRWVQYIDKSVIHNRLQVGLSGYIGYDFAKHFEGKVPLTIFVGYGANGINNFDKYSGQKFFAYHQPYFGLKWKL